MPPFGPPPRFIELFGFPITPADLLAPFPLPPLGGNLIPAADATFDIGTALLRWKDLRLSGVAFINGNAVVSGTLFTGPITPNVDNASDIGTALLTYRTLYAKTSIVGGDHFFLFDNSYDLGQAAIRMRSGFFGTSLVIGVDPGGARALRVGGDLLVGGVEVSAGVNPTVDNAVDLGTAALRFRQLFLSSFLNLSADRAPVLSNQTSSAGALLGTLTNAPAAGDPTFWLKITVNTVALAIPCWPG